MAKLSLLKLLFLIKTSPGFTSCFKSVNDQTIFVAASNDPQQPWFAAALDFDTFIEDPAVLSSLLSFITL